MINFRSVDDMNQLIKAKLHTIPNVDCIIGVPRSGMLPATLIALYLGKPLISIEQLGSQSNQFTNRIPLNNLAIKKALVVDDSCFSGNAMNKVREYLKSCYQNINSESILNFFKCFLHPIDSIKSLGENIGSFQDILKESLNYLYQFIDDYSDLWRLLGVIAMIFIFWLIIKKIIKMFKKNDKKKKNTNENFNINC